MPDRPYRFYHVEMKIRHKLIILMFIYISGIAIVLFTSVRSRIKAEEIHESLRLGMELQIKSREVQSLMKDIVFDLFSPKMYGQLRSLTFSPRSAVTLKEWQEALFEYNRTFDEFMKLEHFFRKGDSHIRDQYLTAITMNDRANEMLSSMEDKIQILRSQYRSVDNLYNAMQKEESLIPFFTEFQETSYYFKNSFESFMNYFIKSLKDEGDSIQRGINLSFLLTSLITVIISLLFTLLMSRDLVNKLKMVEGSLRKVAKGNFSFKVDLRSNDEFGDFSSTLDDLMSELKENVNSILNLTRDIGGNISQNTDVGELYKLVATAVTEDTAADSVMILRGDRERGYTIEAERGARLPDEDREKILGFFTGRIVRHHLQIQIDDAVAELGCSPSVQSFLAVPLMAEGKFFGILISIKQTEGDRFSDLGVTRLATFAEYASLTINNFFQVRELLEVRDARYQALQAQVQPHFLYNILGVILGLNRTDEREKLRETVTALKEMLRYIQSQNSWTSLEEECQFIEKYCMLQKIRFGERFSYNISLDEKARNIRIPRLLLQPLTENSVIHGIEPLERPGYLEVICTATRIRGEEGADIFIRDNGAGFDSENMDNKMNTGLLNVSQRLKIAFPHSVFEITSRPGEGAEVRISL